MGLFTSSSVHSYSKIHCLRWHSLCILKGVAEKQWRYFMNIRLRKIKEKLSKKINKFIKHKKNKKNSSDPSDAHIRDEAEFKRMYADMKTY
jgi:hypothetical protein